jgi:preprotein translocase subunit SecE
MADKIKIVIAVLLVVAGVAAFYAFGDKPAIVKIGAVLAGLVAGFAVFWTTEQGKRFYIFTQESIAETRKVVWPTRRETLQTTGIVFAFVVIMAIFLWIVDASLLWIVKRLIGQGDA